MLKCRASTSWNVESVGFNVSGKVKENEAFVRFLSYEKLAPKD